ncbi:hypothetical protein F4804DRAFT_324104 [Jackrogersella minutella]|nr:hypothetical protein F4804DRAFT_324104 [Jackrogersella minutella]
MNWTEGNLSRHSRGRQRNELLIRQKQHFAKVRNGLHNGGVKQSPISISFLGTQRSKDLKRREYSNSMTCQSPSSPLLIKKRKRTPDSSDSLGHQLSIREKRRRLLDKEDWVGLNLQQPIDIGFPGQHQAITGSRWAGVSRPRVRAAQKLHRRSDTTRLEASQKAHSHPLKVQIGSQVINSSVSTTSRRYSLAPQPSARSSQRRPNPIPSPEPSQAHHLYLAPNNVQPSQMPRRNHHETERISGAGHFKGPVKPPLSEDPPYVVCASSIIHEPAPRRKNHNHMVLHWSPSMSEDGGSMQVEIERQAKSIPPSQDADHEFWRNLVANSSDNLPIDISTSSQVATSLQNSRASALPSHLQRRLPSYEISSEPRRSTGYGFSELSTSDQDTPAAIYAEDVNTSRKQTPDHPQVEVKPVDENSAWMKFAFDGDIDELEATVFAEAAHQAAAELLPSDTSENGADTSATTMIDETEPAGSEKKGDDSLSSGTSSESRMATHGTVASESVYSNIATAGSTSVVESEPRFRFAQPRIFVGKLADSDVTTTQGPPPLLHHGKRRGRPKKRTADGRANIRRLPDFDGDPIEEFDDE